MSQKKIKRISCILPCFNESLNIDFAYKSIVDVWTTESLDDSYECEMIFVDDGSDDDTAEKIIRLTEMDRRVKLIELSRNFGKEVALTAGIHYSDSDAIILLDTDMQYPVEKIPEFLSAWESGYDIVIGKRDAKKTNNLVEKYGSKLFYIIMNAISEHEVISGALDFRLMDKKVVTEFNKFTEHDRTTRVLIDWLGFKKHYLHYIEKERQFGIPGYTFSKRLKLAINSFILHSFFPMEFIGYFGGMISLISLTGGIFMFVIKFMLSDPYRWNLSGSTLLGALNTFLTGLVLISLGVTAHYIATIQRETTNRPLYVIRNIFE